MPRDDAEAVAAAALDLERARPAVVSERLHERLLPLSPLHLEADRGAERLVPVAEDIGLDVHPVSHRTLDRKAPAVHLRPDVLDLDPGRRLG